MGYCIRVNRLVEGCRGRLLGWGCGRGAGVVYWGGAVGGGAGTGRKEVVLMCGAPEGFWLSYASLMTLSHKSCSEAYLYAEAGGC